MSELLQNWLNYEVGLSTNVTSFEKDFANGYLFGEILQKYRQQDDFQVFENRNTYEAKIGNFKRLEPTFKGLGIKFNATQSNAMMNGERGASLRLLYQLKMATERLLLASDTGAEKDKGGPGSGAGGGVTRCIRIPRGQFDGHEKRFFEHRLRSTCLNVKQAREQKMMKKYEDEQAVQERVAYDMDTLDQARIAEQRDLHRQALRENMRRNNELLGEWKDKGTKAWQQNQNIKGTREGAEIAFETRMMRKGQDRRSKIRDTATTEVQGGIEAFESSLAKLGLARDDDVIQATTRGVDESSSEDDNPENQADRLVSNTTQAANSRELVEALQARLPNSQALSLLTKNAALTYR